MQNPPPPPRPIGRGRRPLTRVNCARRRRASAAALRRAALQPPGNTGDSVPSDDVDDVPGAARPTGPAGPHKAARLQEREQLAAWLRRRRRMLFLEAEVAADRFFELGKRTLAVLRGEFCRYEMRSKEVLIGRPLEGLTVDFDLAKAGPAGRVSARQAIIRFEVDCRFLLINVGHRPVYVCGQAVPTHCSMHLADNDLVEIAGLAFVFLVNQWLVGKARRHVLPGEGDDSNDDDA